MVLVSDDEFPTLKPKIEYLIKQSSFIAIDFEFFGLDLSKITLFDTLSSRYRILRETVQRYHPCQLGISCFQQTENGNWIADYFSIPLLKRFDNGTTLISHDAVDFLRSNNFNVDQVFKTGVTFCNDEESERFLNLLEDGNSARIFQSDVSKLILDLKGRVECEKQNEKFTIMSPIIEKLSFIEKLYLKYELSKTFKTMDFDFHENEMNVQPSRNSQSAEILKNRLLSALQGVSTFFKIISKQKKVLIGHNCLLDYMYLYNYFFSPLPENCDDFKKRFHEFFPYVVDTKVLVDNVRKELSAHGVCDSSLKTLGDFFVTPEADKLIPLKLRVIDEWSFADTTDQDYHDAGFDAFISGEIFVKLSHVYIKRSTKTNENTAFRRIIEYLRLGISNQLSLSLMDSKYLNLTGSENSVRPDSIKICGKNLEILSEKVWNSEMERLSWIVGDYKFDFRISDDGKFCEIATNTAATFAFVCDKYSTNSKFQLLDELKMSHKFSYEQRFTSFRANKNGNNGDYGRNVERIRDLERILEIE